MYNFKMNKWLLIALVVVLAPLPAQAEPLRDTIHLIAHSDIGDQRFLYDIKCMLEAIYTLQVLIHEPYDFDFTQSFRNARGQYRASDLLTRTERQAHIHHLSKSGLVFYFLQPDLYDKRYRGGNFLLALRRFKTKVNIISMARLRHTDNDITADRVFRLVAKNTADLNGHTPSGQCFMGFSHSLDILDTREIRLCEPDLSALQKMGLVHPEIQDGNILKGCLILSANF